MAILAIDPGSEQSAFVVWDGKQIIAKGILPNIQMRDRCQYHDGINVRTMVIEQIKSYGMRVGKDVFDTVWWSGRFWDAWTSSGGEAAQIPRKTVATHLCLNATAGDSSIKIALKDRFGKPGTVKAPNLTYGEVPGDKDSKLKADLWSALAIAVTWWDLNQTNNRRIKS